MDMRGVWIGLFGLGLGATPAMAAVDTMQALVKCSQIADAGQRLTCYDGVMPKVRAELAPAPQDLSKDDQVSLFGLNLSDIFGPARQATPQQFGQERVKEPQAPAAAAPVGPTAPTAPPAQVAIAQPAAPARPQPVERISAAVTDYSLTPIGRFVVFLDNGQVWRQLDADTTRALFKRAAADNKVTISRGAFGSYNLQLNESNALFKVTRVK